MVSFHMTIDSLVGLALFGFGCVCWAAIISEMRK